MIVVFASSGLVATLSMLLAWIGFGASWSTGIAIYFALGCGLPLLALVIRTAPAIGDALWRGQHA